MDAGCTLFVIPENIVIRMVFMRFYYYFLSGDVIIAVSELKWLAPFKLIYRHLPRGRIKVTYCFLSYIIVSKPISYIFIFSTVVVSHIFVVFYFGLTHIEQLIILHLSVFLFVLCNRLIFDTFSYQLLYTIIAERNVRSCCTPLTSRTRPPCLTTSEGWYAFY